MGQAGRATRHDGDAEECLVQGLQFQGQGGRAEEPAETGNIDEQCISNGNF